MMDALTLLREQAERADSLLTDVFAVATPEQAHWKLADSTTNTIAGDFLHIYYSEDTLVNKRFRSKATVFEAGGWAERLGYDPQSPWTAASPADLDAYHAYAREVRAATKTFLDELDSAELEREVVGPRGPRSVASSLSLILIIHKANHTGEIAALLGCQGVKGFPF
jgi:uncharacterized damage-inducible protein DinB